MELRFAACVGCLALCACSFDVPTGRLGASNREPDASAPVAGADAAPPALADAAIGMACDPSLAAVLPAAGRYRGAIHACIAGSTPLELPAADGGTVFANIVIDVDLDPSAATQQGALNAFWALGDVIGFQLTWRGALDCRSGELSGTYDGGWGVPQSGDLDNPMLLLQGGKSMGELHFRRAGKSDAIEGTINLVSFANTGDAMDMEMNIATSWCNGQLNAARDP